MSTKIFLDSCNPIETKTTIDLLGKLDGQTTNPSLLIKNPNVQDKVQGGKIKESDLLALYKEAIQEISSLIPNGSVSIEVYADQNSTTSDLLKQAEEFNNWIPNAHIKFPTIKVGLEAAENFVNNGGKVNMTLVFSQEQALAVHKATQNAKNKGDVFISPFVGRLDDIRQNGLDLIQNILKMYKELDSKVQVLAASIRTFDQFKACVDMDCDLITAPLKAIQNYQENEKQNIIAVNSSLNKIAYLNFDTNKQWQDLNYQHDLTDKGLDKFVADWKGVLL